MKAWMRDVMVILYSPNDKTKGYTFGTDFDISISGLLKMGAKGDSFTIRIKNLAYSMIVDLITNQYFNVEIRAGYKTNGMRTIFRGGVLYIWNEIDTDKTSTCTILCGSYLAARFSQSRINLSFTNGINVYNAVKYMLNQIGAKHSAIDSSLREQVFTDIVNINSTASSWLDQILNANSSFVSSTDSANGSIFDLYDVHRTHGKLFKLKSTDIILTRGRPTITTNGTDLQLLPTFQISPGDVVEVENWIFNVGGVGDLDTATEGFGFDPYGQYIVYQISYDLQTRGGSYEMSLNCKSRTSFLSQAISEPNGR